MVQICIHNLLSYKTTLSISPRGIWMQKYIKSTWYWKQNSNKYPEAIHSLNRLKFSLLTVIWKWPLVSIQSQACQVPGGGKESFVLLDFHNTKQLLSPMLLEFHILSMYFGIPQTKRSSTIYFQAPQGEEFLMCPLKTPFHTIPMPRSMSLPPFPAVSLLVVISLSLPSQLKSDQFTLWTYCLASRPQVL